MRYIFILATGCLALLSSCNRQEYPKRIGDRLYTTDSTFYIMDGADTLTKLLNKKMELAYPQRIGDRLYITDSTFHIMDGADTSLSQV